MLAEKRYRLHAEGDVIGARIGRRAEEHLTG